MLKRMVSLGKRSWLCVVWLAMAAPVWGQAKRQVQTSDYRLWSRTYGEAISNDAQWYAYRSHYPQLVDTLFLRPTGKGTGYAFAHGLSGRFNATGRWFLVNIKGGDRILVDLKNQRKYPLAHAYQVRFSKDGRYFIQATDPANGNGLIVWDLKRSKRDTLKKVKRFKLHKQRNLLAYAAERFGKWTLSYIDLDKGFGDFPTLSIVNSPIRNISWDASGRFLLFSISDTHDHGARLLLYDLATGDKRTLDLKGRKGFQGYWITDAAPRISPDGKRVLFRIWDQRNKELSQGPPDPKAVQLWGGRDSLMFPHREANRAADHGPKRSLWYIDTDEVVRLEQGRSERVVVDSGLEHALVYSTGYYDLEGRAKGSETTEIHAMDLRSGKRKSITQGQPNSMGHSHISPNGKYIGYFKNGDWYLYDTQTQKTHWVTQDLKGKAGRAYRGIENFRAPIGTEGWTRRDKDFLFLAGPDLWRYSPGQAELRRLTQGKELKVGYDIHRGPFELTSKHDDPYYTTFRYDLDKGILLETLDQKMGSGYTLLDSSGPHTITQGDFKVQGIVRAAKGKYLIKKERFEVPTYLGLHDQKGRETVLFRSNPHQKDFQWGRSELMEYRDAKGRPLKGALYYPADYKKGDVYPMVVHVYEVRSTGLHAYHIPTPYEHPNFNIANFTTQGYFVFEPDIYLEDEGPGRAALSHIRAGVAHVLQKGDVDHERLGLTGYSFGGYETLSVIGRTDMFKAAYAGAGIADLMGFYLGMHAYSHEGGLFQLESQQFQMQKPFYSDQELFLNNSPIHWADHINTPLLLSTGQRDRMVDWEQSFRMYLALRRLGKEVLLLVYPEEDHINMDPTNQRDLNKRVLDWFDKYLK
ncbi:S9 family peptidase [Sediminicola luteus]|nr:prolyl oligopeptidase family serine peptidase [Sediminicola luteus]